jgi:peptidoglycan hydrolase CwlO-like protein
MIENGHTLNGTDREIKAGLEQIKQYLETHIRELTASVQKKDAEIAFLKEELKKTKSQAEGNSQLINKLLGDLNKLHNDIDWYKRTYEKRSLLGTIREKLFRK